MPENIRSELSHTSYNKASWGKGNMGAWCTGTKPSPVFETLGWWFTIICSKALAAPHSPMAQEKSEAYATTPPPDPLTNTHTWCNSMLSIAGTSPEWSLYLSRTTTKTNTNFLDSHLRTVCRAARFKNKGGTQKTGSTWCFLRMPAMYNQRGSCTSSPH